MTQVLRPRATAAKLTARMLCALLALLLVAATSTMLRASSSRETAIALDPNDPLAKIGAGMPTPCTSEGCGAAHGRGSVLLDCSGRKRGAAHTLREAVRRAPINGEIVILSPPQGRTCAADGAVIDKPLTIRPSDGIGTATIEGTVPPPVASFPPIGGYSSVDPNASALISLQRTAAELRRDSAALTAHAPFMRDSEAYSDASDAKDDAKGEWDDAEETLAEKAEAVTKGRDLWSAKLSARDAADKKLQEAKKELKKAPNDPAKKQAVETAKGKLETAQTELDTAYNDLREAESKADAAKRTRDEKKAAYEAAAAKLAATNSKTKCSVQKKIEALRRTGEQIAADASGRKQDHPSLARLQGEVSQARKDVSDVIGILISRADPDEDKCTIEENAAQRRAIAAAQTFNGTLSRLQDRILVAGGAAGGKFGALIEAAAGGIPKSREIVQPQPDEAPAQCPDAAALRTEVITFANLLTARERRDEDASDLKVEADRLRNQAEQLLWKTPDACQKTHDGLSATKKQLAAFIEDPATPAAAQKGVSASCLEAKLPVGDTLSLIGVNFVVRSGEYPCVSVLAGTVRMQHARVDSRGTRWAFDVGASGHLALENTRIETDGGGVRARRASVALRDVSIQLERGRRGVGASLTGAVGTVNRMQVIGGEVGLLVSAGSRDLVVDQLEVSDAGVGLQIVGHAGQGTVDVRAPNIQRALVGAWVRENARAQIVGGVIRDNERVGILISDSGAVVRGARIDGRRHAIAIHRSSQTRPNRTPPPSSALCIEAAESDGYENGCDYLGNLASELGHIGASAPLGAAEPASVGAAQVDQNTIGPSAGAPVLVALAQRQQISLTNNLIDCDGRGPCIDLGRTDKALRTSLQLGGNRCTNSRSCEER